MNKSTHFTKLLNIFVLGITLLYIADMIRFELKLSMVFNFYTTCVEVAFFTSTQVAAKCFFTSAQVGQKLDFGLPTKLVGGLFFIPDKLSGS